MIGSELKKMIFNPRLTKPFNVTRLTKVVVVVVVVVGGGVLNFKMNPQMHLIGVFSHIP